MADLYIVEKKAQAHLHGASSYLVETNLNEATEEATFRNLMHDQHDGMAVRVYKLTDVTAEFRAKLIAEIDRNHYGVIPSWLVFLMVG